MNSKDFEVAGPLQGHWDPAALRYVDYGPQTTVEGIANTQLNVDPNSTQGDDGSISQRDGNGNGIPNEYGDGPDLDGNGVPDDIGIFPDMLRDDYPDKDADGIPDSEYKPSLPDGNGNGVPGEYGDGPDLDGNGIPDEIGINPDSLQPGYPGGGLPDGNANGISGEYGDGPDLDANGVPDEIGINPDNQQPGYPVSDPNNPAHENDPAPRGRVDEADPYMQRPYEYPDVIDLTEENPPFLNLQDTPPSTDPRGALPGHWDPAALRWVPDVPTTVEGEAADLDVAAPIGDASTTVEGSAASGYDAPHNPIQPGPSGGQLLDPTDDRIWVYDENYVPPPDVLEEPPSVSIFEQDLDGYGLYEEATDDEGFDPLLDGGF